MVIARRKLVTFVTFTVFALLLIGGAGVLWGALIYANLRTSPSVPWSLPVLLGFLGILWRVLGGAGWPRRTSRARRQLLRANPVGTRTFQWSCVAGVLAIGSLAGLWIIMFDLFSMRANVLLPVAFTSSPVLIAAITVGASILAPIVEESAIRGYLQSALEREFTPGMAVLLSSAVFAIAHVSQGFALPKLLVYLVVGVTFGSLAYLSDSILPVIPVHVAADLVFFLLIWPNDSTRSTIWQTGINGWFVVHVAQFLIFGALSLAAFRKIAMHAGARRRISKSLLVSPLSA